MSEAFCADAAEAAAGEEEVDEAAEGHVEEGVDPDRCKEEENGEGSIVGIAALVFREKRPHYEGDKFPQ